MRTTSARWQRPPGTRLPSALSVTSFTMLLAATRHAGIHRHIVAGCRGERAVAAPMPRPLRYQSVTPLPCQRPRRNRRSRSASVTVTSRAPVVAAPERSVCSISRRQRIISSTPTRGAPATADGMPSSRALVLPRGQRLARTIVAHLPQDSRVGLAATSPSARLAGAARPRSRPGRSPTPPGRCARGSRGCLRRSPRRAPRRGTPPARAGSACTAPASRFAFSFSMTMRSCAACMSTSTRHPAWFCARMYTPCSWARA